jgi:hypothetical protein
MMMTVPAVVMHGLMLLHRSPMLSRHSLLVLPYNNLLLSRRGLLMLTDHSVRGGKQRETAKQEQTRQQ